VSASALDFSELRDKLTRADESGNSLALGIKS